MAVMIVSVPLNWLGSSDSVPGDDDNVYPIDLLVVDDGIVLLLFLLLVVAAAAGAAAVCSASIGVGALRLLTLPCHPWS